MFYSSQPYMLAHLCDKTDRVTFVASLSLAELDVSLQAGVFVARHVYTCAG